MERSPCLWAICEIAVGWALHQRGSGVRPDGRLHGRQVLRVHHLVANAKVVEDLCQHAVGATIHVGGNDDLVAGVQEREHCGYGGHAGPEGEAGDAALQVRDQALQSCARGVAGARVLPLDVAANVLLPVGGSLVDGHVDRARVRVRSCAGVDEAAFEAEELFRRLFRVLFGCFLSHGVPL